MKKILMAGMAAIAALAVAEARAMSLQEAGEKVIEAAENPTTLAGVLKELSEEDQLKFLATLNESIEKMPVSEEEKVAKAVDANTAAVRAAANRTAMIAEVFATASPAALAVINEKFAPAIFDPALQLSADKKAAAAAQIMKSVESRTAQAGVTDAEKRNAAAVLMFTRASEDLKEPLLAEKENAEQVSKWIDASVKLNNYKWLVGSKDVNLTASMMMMAPDVLSGAYLADLTAEGTPFVDAMLDANQYALPLPMNDYGLSRIPRSMNKEDKWYSGAQRGDGTGDSGLPRPQPEPDPYH